MIHTGSPMRKRPYINRRKEANLAHGRLLELLEYSPETGLFVWRVDRPGHKCAGTVAGTKVADRFIIGIDGLYFSAHRLAWFYMTGTWPSYLVDHKNRNPHDNRWENLREAKPSQNLANSIKRKNKTGYRGVKREKSGKKFSAKINVNHREIHLGSYSSPEEAHEAYRAASVKYYGEFAGCK